MLHKIPPCSAPSKERASKETLLASTVHQHPDQTRGHLVATPCAAACLKRSPWGTSPHQAAAVTRSPTKTASKIPQNCGFWVLCEEHLLPGLRPHPSQGGQSTRQGQDCRAQPTTGLRALKPDGEGVPGVSRRRTRGRLTSRHILRGGGQQRQEQGGAEPERRSHGGAGRPERAGGAAWEPPPVEGRAAGSPSRPVPGGPRGTNHAEPAVSEREEEEEELWGQRRWLEKLPARLSFPARRAERPRGLPEPTARGSRPPPLRAAPARPQEGARSPREGGRAAAAPGDTRPLVTPPGPGCCQPEREVSAPPPPPARHRHPRTG